MDFLHSHRIVHRDLKPQNLLVTKEDVVKLTDFGLARIYEFYTLLTSVVVTLWYRSPEVLMGLSYATPVDIWSCGCIFAELFLRKPLFPGGYEMDQLSKIFDVIGTPGEEEWPESAALTRTNFKSCPAKTWNEIVPEMDSQAQDLIQVSILFFIVASVCMHLKICVKKMYVLVSKLLHDPMTFTQAPLFLKEFDRRR